MPPAPARAFASDNAAGAHPKVVEAVLAANEGHALAYGSDEWTGRAEAGFRDLFGPRTQSYLVWNGTGANVMALGTMVRPGDAVVCSEWAHVAVDETGAPERSLGVKLLPQPTATAKLVPAQLEALTHLQGVQHHAQPGVVSITQSTELGTLYTAEEVAALCDTAHRMGMRALDLDDRFTISADAVKKQARVFKSVLKLDKNFHIYIHGDRNKIERGVDEAGRKFYKIYYEQEL